MASPRVQLWSARIPGITGLIADHFWFVIAEQSELIRQDRWEVWQTKDCGGKSWGHIHKNLKAYSDNVGSGESRLVQEWTDEEAQRLIMHIEKSGSDYPYKHTYRYWPGPNSNTYVQWLLNQANINYRLDSSAIGKNYLKLGVIFKRL